MDAMTGRVQSARNLDELRGLEGQGAKEYFSLFRRLLRPPSEGGTWGFERRAYYPPTDPVNALLSFTYSLLLRDIVTACELIGLDPYLGFFHAIDYGRPSMALDLMEEFRPIVADSVVLEAANRLTLEGIEAEVIDLRVLRPLDTATVLASVKKTHRAVIIDEAWRTGSFAAEISARIMEGGFYDLDGPVARVCSAEVPLPYPKHLEEAALPSVASIMHTVRAVMGAKQ